MAEVEQVDDYGRPISGAYEAVRDRFGDFRPLGYLKDIWNYDLSQHIPENKKAANADTFLGRLSMLNALRGMLKGASQAVPDAPGHIAQGITDTLTLPQRAFEASENYRQTGQYDPGPGIEAALLTMGGTSLSAPAGATGAGPVASRARDPALWHGLSDVKLRKPVSEMSAERTIADPAVVESAISPEKLQGGVLLPALGDRSAVGGNLTKVGDVALPTPVELQGGPGFMSQPGPHVWASEQSRMSAMANRVKYLQDRFGTVYSPYTAMGERAVDFSHHVSDTLAEMVKQSPLTIKGAQSFDELMRAGPRNKTDFPAAKDWPGVTSPELREYLANAPGGIRAKFAKTMDKASFAKEGFPDVAEARFAVTDPRLVNAPTGSSGMLVSRLDPVTSPSAHRTYSTGIHGEYLGGLGSIPREVMYPDIVEAFAQRGFHPRQSQYLMERGTQPVYQETNQRWLDSVSDYMAKRDKGMILGAGAGDRRGALLSSTALDPIRAYHGSPHNFDRFDISKIGTGEGAQSFGHGLYFAEREGTARSYRDALQKTVSPHLMLDDVRITPGMVKSMRTSRDEIESYLARNHPDILLSRGRAAYDKLFELQKRSLDDAAMWNKRKADYEANPPIASTYTPLDYEVRAHAAQSRADQLGEFISRVKAQQGGPTGKMYEVNIHADPAQMINYDTNLAGQTPLIQDKLRSIGVQPRHVDVGAAKQEAQGLIDLLRQQKGYAPWVSDALNEYSTAISSADSLNGVYRALKNIPSELGIGEFSNSGIFRDVGSQFMQGVGRAKRSTEAQPILSDIDAVTGNAQRTAHALRDVDIPGIRYLDAGSRIHGEARRMIDNYGSREAALAAAEQRLKSAGMGDLRFWDGIVKQLQRPESSNYVILNDRLIDIARKYAIPGVVGGAAALDQTRKQ